ncbi:hypothetical protein A2V68_00340 [candidate division Kazan bacterium RBG_13_50_9]|uniref:Glutaredoxin domain-containing protein n=1 Tax=candidate division Kazan bacterium RBG_13_50_9 TaxID=1798535 RepID=A0A1F4NS09_UNCK3|nr:MAG: hypothetical protein A2V68_00340 [candidate division Kazan bacterium RBG_13_50_9]
MPKVKRYLIYSTPACVYCRLLKQWLGKSGIAFEEVNVAADPIRGQEMIQRTGQMGVPVSIITFADGREEIVLGFNQAQLKDLLGLGT